MSTPVLEQIASNIETSVNEITEANGYSQDLTAVRPRRNDYKDVSPDDLTVLIFQGDEEIVETAPIGVAEYRQPFMLFALVIDSDSETASMDTRRNQVRADIIKKLMTDTSRGGLAIDTLVEPSRMFDDEDGFAGIAVNFSVFYRTKPDDPYTQM